MINKGEVGEVTSLSNHMPRHKRAGKATVVIICSEGSVQGQLGKNWTSVSDATEVMGVQQAYDQRHGDVEGQECCGKFSLMASAHLLH